MFQSNTILQHNIAVAVSSLAESERLVEAQPFGEQ